MNKLKRFSATAIALPLTAAVALSSTGVAVAADKETPSSSATETPSASGETTLNIAVDGLDDGTEVKLVTAKGDEVDSQKVEDSKVAFTYDKGDKANQVLSIKVDGKIYETIGGQCAGVINSTPATDSNGGLITGDDTDGIDITKLPGGDKIPSTPGGSKTPGGSENPTSSPSLPGGGDLTPSLPGDDTTPSGSESPSASGSEKPSASGSKTPTSGSEKPGATSGSETPSASEKPKNDGSNTPAGDEKPSATSTADADKPGSDKPGSDKPGSDKPGSDKPGDTGAQARSAVSLQADNGVNFTVDSSGNIYLENNQDGLGIDDLTLASQSDRFDVNTILGAVGGVDGLMNIASSVLPEILGEGGGEVGKFLNDAKNSEIVKGADNIVKFLAPIAKVLHPLAKNPAIAAIAGPILTSKTGLPWEVVVKVLEVLASGQGVSGAISMVENFLSGKGLVMDDPNASTDGTTPTDGSTPGGATTPGDDLIGGVDGGTDGSGDLGTGTDTTPGEGDGVATPNPDGTDPVLVPGDAVAPILDEVVNQIEAKTKSADINLDVDEASFTIDPANEADLITCDFEFQEAKDKDKDKDKEKPSETKSSSNSKSNKTPAAPALANSPAQAANPAAAYGPKVDTGGSVVEENFFAKVSHRIASFF